MGTTTGTNGPLRDTEGHVWPRWCLLILAGLGVLALIRPIPGPRGRY